MLSACSVFAISAQEPVSITFTVLPVKKKQDMRPITMKEFFIQYCTKVAQGVPQVYTQIPLRISGIDREDKLYGALQKCVYLGFIPNSTVSYKWTSTVSPKFINLLIDKNLEIDPDLPEEKQTITRADLSRIMDMLPNYQMLMSIGALSRWGANFNYHSPLIKAQGFGVLTQIYNSFKSDYWSGDEVEDDNLLQGAIRGMTESVGDIHTEYFPPADAQQFNDQLNGSFE